MAEKEKLDPGNLSMFNQWSYLSQNVGFFGQQTKPSDRDLVEKLAQTIGGSGD